MKTEERMQNYTFIVNIGNQKMTNYLSHTYLLPYIDKNNVFLYYFLTEFDKSLEDKLKEVFIDIKNLTLDTTNQFFRIVYYNSNYNNLILDKVANDSENTLLYFTNKILYQVKEYDKLVKRFSKFEHIHIFHEPWFDADIEEHKKIVKDKVVPILKEYNKNNKRNTFFTYRFAQIQGNPAQLAFDLMSFESMKYVVKIVDTGEIDIIKNCKLKDDYICIQEVSDITDEYDKALPKYKAKLIKNLEFLKKEETTIKLSLYKDDTVFWTEEKISDNEIDELSNETIKDIICPDEKQGCYTNYKTFTRRWKTLEQDLYNRIHKLLEIQKSKKYNFSKNGEFAKENLNPFLNNNNKPSREVLEDLIKTYEERLSNELNKSFDFDTRKKYKEIEDKIKVHLNNFRWKFGELLQKFPSNKSILFLFISYFLVIFSPAILLLKVFRIESKEWGQIFITNLEIASAVYATFLIIGFFWLNRYYRKYNSLVSGLRHDIESIFKEYEDTIIKKSAEELTSYNLRVLYKENLDIIKKELKEYLKKDKQSQEKKKIISAILDLGVLSRINAEKDVKINFNKNKFFRNIEFDLNEFKEET